MDNEIGIVNRAYFDDTYEYLLYEKPDLYYVNMDWKNALLAGYVQAGKTGFMLSIALLKILSGQPCILVLRNSTKDSVQIRAKALRFANGHVEHMKKLGYVNTPTIEVVLASTIKSRIDKKTDMLTLTKYDQVLESLVPSRDSGIPKLVIAMANGYQLRYINMLLDTFVPNSNFLLLTDEADSVAYSEIKILDTPEHHCALEYEVLYNRAKQVFEVSATVFDVLVGNTSLPTRNIVIVRPSHTYKGIRGGIQFIKLPIEEILGWNSSMSSIHDSDPNILPIYLELSNQGIYKSKSRYNLAYAHPIICLHKTVRTRSHHDAFMLEFKTNRDLRSVWTVVVEDGRGIRVYNRSLIGQRIVIRGQVMVDPCGAGEFFTFGTGIDIQDVLQWFFDNGGAQRFHHIVIKSGDLASRSTSYVSTNGYWHLTHQYYVPAVVDTVPSMIQACRLCHDRPDSIPLYMFAPKRAILDIQRGFLVQEEQIERFRTSLIDAETESDLTHVQVRESTWMSVKVPKAKMCKSKLNKSFKLNKIKIGTDSGWNADLYSQIESAMIEYVPRVATTSMNVMNEVSTYSNNGNADEVNGYSNHDNTTDASTYHGINSEWRLILEDKLIPEHRVIYRNLIDHCPRGVSIKKGDLIGLAYKPSEIENIRSKTWYWHNDTSVNRKCIEVGAGVNSIGLLFTKHGNDWLVKYNEK